MNDKPVKPVRVRPVISYLSQISTNLNKLSLSIYCLDQRALFHTRSISFLFYSVCQLELQREVKLFPFLFFIFPVIQLSIQNTSQLNIPAVQQRHSSVGGLGQGDNCDTSERGEDRVVKFAIQIGSDWPQMGMGQIWDFLRSVSVHFGSSSQNVLKLILKFPDLSHLGPI